MKRAKSRVKETSALSSSRAAGRNRLKPEKLPDETQT
jgi:hypothetical protein